MALLTNIIISESCRDIPSLECLLGLAVGTTLGAFWEGTSNEPIEISEESLRTVMGVDCWRWTDDTQMTLSIVSI